MWLWTRDTVLALLCAGVLWGSLYAGSWLMAQRMVVVIQQMK